MGAGWRRVSELARQKLHISDKDFVATPNMRNELMLKEAGEFSAHLKRCEQDISALKEATEALVNTAKIVLSAPLPRVYEDAGNGKAQPVVPGNRPPGLIGGEFNAEELGRVSKDTGKKLDAEVLAPMQRWLTAYNTVVARMKKLEALRLEVDSRRRTVSLLGQKVEKQRAKLPQTRTKGEIEMESTIKTLQHKESKLTAARQSFKEHESIVYQQLAQLIRDAVWLKSYISAVLRVEQEAFASAHVAIGPTATQLPMHEGSAMSGVPATPDAMALQSKDHMMQPMPSAGKENSNVPPMVPQLPVKQDYAFDAPPVPTHRYQVPAAPAYSYQDRYSAPQQQYGQAMYH